MNRYLATVILALAFSLMAYARPASQVRAIDNERIAEVIKLHNAERARAELHSLEVNARLQKAADRHARDMAARKKMSHIGSDDSKPVDRVKDAGYDYRRAGENVAFGRFTPVQLMEGWMESAVHKRNILGSFSQIGVAAATAEDGMTYWCVTFGLPRRD